MSFTYQIDAQQTFSRIDAINNNLYEEFKDWKYFSIIQCNDTVYNLEFGRSLTTEELTTLTNFLKSYVLPSFYKVFRYSIDAPMSTIKTNSSEYVLMSTMINSANTISEDPSIAVKLGSIKVVVNYHIENIQDFLQFDEYSSNTISIQFYDLTRSVILVESQVNINDILTTCKTEAQNGTTGSRDFFKSVQFYGLVNSCPSHDCIWQIKAKISTPLVNISLNGLQKMYYEVYYI